MAASSRAATAVMATMDWPWRWLNRPEARGSWGLLMRSIATSVSWLSPTMYTFAARAGSRAAATSARHRSGSIPAASGEAGGSTKARTPRAITLSRVPQIVWGREKAQRAAGQL